MKKIFLYLLPAGIVLVAFAAWWLLKQPQDQIKMLPATVEVSPDIERLVMQALAKTNVKAKNFSITSIDKKGGKIIVSVAGLNEARPGWTIEESTWTGTITIAPEAHTGQVQEAGAQTEYGMGFGGSAAILPFASGSTAYYGTLGVHNCGYSLDGWKAVDLFPAEGQIYASTSGTISYVCRDSKQVALRIGNNMYAHVVDSGQAVGDYYDQAQLIGSLVKGTFNEPCGYADQQPENAHVHYCFIPDNGKFLADGYTLDTGTSTWTKEGKPDVTPGGTLVADWQNAQDIWQPSTEGGMFNVFDWLLAGLQSIAWWIMTTFFLPPGTSKTTVFYMVDWSRFFGSGVWTVLQLTGAALSVFNWWIPAAAFFIDMVLLVIQLAVSIYQFVLGIIKKIPFL